LTMVYIKVLTPSGNCLPSLRTEVPSSLIFTAVFIWVLAS
jgi:hypothetical protein